jgi:hypothetical protein
MPRKPKDGKEKSPQEKETAFVEKVEHAMSRVADWSEKLVKLSRSRKGYMTDEDHTKLASDYRDLTNGVLEALETPLTEKAKASYKLR